MTTLDPAVEPDTTGWGAEHAHDPTAVRDDDGTYWLFSTDACSDGPVRGGGQRPGGAAPTSAAFEGFDPGDEPLDEVIDERTARESSEEQAVRLLRDAFGAEKIDELDAR